MTSQDTVYQPGQPVWVWQYRSWRPGLVLAATAGAAMVRFRPGDQEGAAVDTVTPDRLHPRTPEPGQVLPGGFEVRR